jgi:hypothetical protein
VKGLRYTASVIRDLFWTPFDVRFSKLLGRLHDHQQLFDCEMRLEDQKFLERRLDRTLESIIKSKECDQRSRKSVEENLFKQREANEHLEFEMASRFEKLENGIRALQQLHQSEKRHFEAEGSKKLSMCTYTSWISRG